MLDPSLEAVIFTLPSLEMVVEVVVSPYILESHSHLSTKGDRHRRIMPMISSSRSSR